MSFFNLGDDPFATIKNTTSNIGNLANGATQAVSAYSDKLKQAANTGMDYAEWAKKAASSQKVINVDANGLDIDYNSWAKRAGSLQKVTNVDDSPLDYNDWAKNAAGGQKVTNVDATPLDYNEWAKQAANGQSVVNTAVGSAADIKNSISNALSSIKNGVSGLFSAGEAAPEGSGETVNGKLQATKSVFVCTADEELATVDVYGEKESNPINSITDKLSGVTDTLKSGLKTVSNYVKVGQGYYKQGRAIFDKGMAIYKTYQSINSGKGNLMQRVVGNNQLMQRAFKEMGYSDLANNPFSNYINKSYPTLVKIGNDYTTVSSSLNTNDLRRVGNLLSTYNGVDDFYKVVDNGADLGFGTAAMSEATRVGLPNAYDAITQNWTDEGMVRSLGYASLPQAVRYSDLNTVNDIYNRIGAEGVSSAQPDFERTVAEYYRNKASVSDEKITDAKQYDEVATLFNKTDSNWLYTVRPTNSGEVQAVDLAKFNSASPDFISVMSNGVKETSLESSRQNEAWLALLGKTETRGVDEVLRGSFPGLALSSNQQSNFNNIQPSQLAFS